jgi:hypothetical protein
MTADDPRSAPELEQIILELCAADRPAGIPGLMLVVQGVKEWYVQLGGMHNISSTLRIIRVEAALYRLICLGEPAPLDGFPRFTV